MYSPLYHSSVYLLPCHPSVYSIPSATFSTHQCQQSFLTPVSNHHSTHLVNIPQCTHSSSSFSIPTYSKQELSLYSQMLATLIVLTARLYHRVLTIISNPQCIQLSSPLSVFTPSSFLSVFTPPHLSLHSPTNTFQCTHPFGSHLDRRLAVRVLAAEDLVQYDSKAVHVTRWRWCSR